MAYEKFRTVMSPEEYYGDWGKESLSMISPDRKQTIYNEYLLKCVVFQRDNFKCQNNGCGTEDRLTMHHIKFKKNNGKDSPKNCVTICKGCHSSYHQGKKSLTFYGATYKLDTQQIPQVDWKNLKKKNRKFRKSLGIKSMTISWELFALLMRFLDADCSNINNEGDDD